MTDNGFTLGEARRRIEELEDAVKTQAAANSLVLQEIGNVHVSNARQEEQLNSIRKEQEATRSSSTWALRFAASTLVSLVVSLLLIFLTKAIGG